MFFLPVGGYIIAVIACSFVFASRPVLPVPSVMVGQPLYPPGGKPLPNVPMADQEFGVTPDYSLPHDSMNSTLSSQFPQTMMPPSGISIVTPSMQYGASYNSPYMPGFSGSVPQNSLPPTSVQAAANPVSGNGVLTFADSLYPG
jgi:hypothetical protein